MSFKPIQKLIVSRTLSTGEKVIVGTLAQNRQGVFFQYEADYLSRFGNLSPFTLKSSNELQLAPRIPHGGVHGLFADSLPDGWGLLLQDRVFRQHSILPAQITAMDRLAFVGERGMGALTFSPASSYCAEEAEEEDLATLGLQAQALFDGQTEEVLAALVAAGSSGGARPKAQIFIPPETPEQCHTHARPRDEAWLVKFTSQNLALGHEEGLCEAAYLKMAEMAGLQPPTWKLLEAPAKSGAKAWLAVKRFDWVNHADGSAGRLHMHSACGLLDADYRTPSLDYQDLIKASRQLCKSPAVGQLQFKRAMFNLFASNQDDHSKNWSFLQNDQGQWQPAPFYDATFSPHPFNEHATAFAGYGHQPPLKVIQKLAASAGFANWKLAQRCIEEILEALSGFAPLAKELGVKESTVTAIVKTLGSRRAENKGLLCRNEGRTN
ncbi:type II toxin-antitoxin system HipA family toxin [Neiella sp. HB171785]|uniref:Type II toxin-antitoxin system HipA family toxin n=1 Tax=Neiella litorisoli TaxID=2771431 RepID=A0A8J6QL56_9GAMM|nr:type II toxin-antitoxin system HipA family toxin [Neiella litorisoli]MBD1390132.1 type II toxin-antitoxin system HipA family toxin [Neiella litorisoli]